MSGRLVNGLRPDAVHVLAPRIYEGGGKSSAHWYRGSPSSAYLSQKRAKKNSKHRKIILFDALLPGIRTPPVPALAQGHPLTSAGGKASNHPCTLTARQIPNYQHRLTINSSSPPTGRRGQIPGCAGRWPRGYRQSRRIRSTPWMPAGPA